MKNKVVIICGIAVAALAFGILCYGLSHPDFSIGWPIHFGGVQGYVYNDAEYSVGDGEADVQNVRIAWLYGKVVVKSYDGDTVRFSEEVPLNTEDNARLHYLASGDTLRIYSHASGYGRPLLSWDPSSQTKNLLVEVPSGRKFTVLSIECASADVEISDVSAATLTVEAVSGDVSLNRISADTLDAETVSGDGAFTDVTAESADCSTTSGKMKFYSVSGEKLVIESVSGDIFAEGISVSHAEAEGVSANLRLAFTTCPADIEAETVSGNVTLTLPENSGFTLKTSSVSGDFSSNIAVSVSGKTYTAGDGTCKIRVSTVSGDYTVNE